MPSPDSHPIRRIRKAFQQVGMRDYSTTAGFARRLGCSDSLLRNVESGIVPLSSKLAHLIEKETGASAEWLLGNPGAEDPILDCDGKPWSPLIVKAFSDEFEGVISRLYVSFPEALPGFVGAVIEAVLTLELSGGDGWDVSRPSKMKMQRFLDSFVRPVLRVADLLPPQERERFFRAFRMHLGGRDVAASERLLNLWGVMHTKDETGTHLVGKHRLFAPPRGENKPPTIKGDYQPKKQSASKKEPPGPGKTKSGRRSVN